MDQNMAPGEVVKTPTAELNVVIPASLELICLPHNSLIVLANREVVLKVGILDKEGNKVHLSDNLVIELLVDVKYFQVTSSLTNGTLHIGVPIVPVITKVSATLLGAITCTLATPVTTSNTMKVLAAMSLVPQLSVLSRDPVTHSQYTDWRGHDSLLTWSSSYTSISTTNQLGISSVSGSLLGSSTVTVTMTRASYCQASADIQVLAAAKLIILESEQEFEFGTTLPLLLDLQFSAGSAFTSLFAFHLLPLRLSIHLLNYPHPSRLCSYGGGLQPGLPLHCVLDISHRVRRESHLRRQCSSGLLPHGPHLPSDW